jgi:hypothetical protein
LKLLKALITRRRAFITDKKTNLQKQLSRQKGSLNDGYLSYSTNKLKKKNLMKGDIMANKKQTSSSVASKASKVLQSPSASKTCKSVAASALSQTKKGK